jgi:hypothetical protein
MSAVALPSYGQQWPKVSPITTTSSIEATCSCTQQAALSIEQGLTLSTGMTITINGAPVDITGHELQFTAKPSYDTADDDPATVKVDWYETATPTQGKTTLVVDASITTTMQPVAYPYQIRMVSPSGVVSGLIKGTLTIIEPLSARYT